MAKRKTEMVVTLLLDKSGSMAPIKADTIGAFNTYLKTLQETPEGITFSFLQFDTNSVDKICTNIPVKDAKLLTDATYITNAGTPLIDAAYKTIKAVEAYVAEKKSKVVICIQTDGQENSSREFSWDQLTTLIKEKTALGWQFNFMGCGIDAYAQGARMGITAVNTMSYDRYDPAATRSAFASSANNAVNFGAGRAKTTEYSSAQRSSAKDKFTPADIQPKSTKAIVDDINL